MLYMTLYKHFFKRPKSFYIPYDKRILKLELHAPVLISGSVKYEVCDCGIEIICSKYERGKVKS